MTSPAPQSDSQPEPNPAAPQTDPGQPESQAPQPDPVQELQAQLLQERRERTAAEFDIPAELFASAETPEDIDRIASEALLWAAGAEPPAPRLPATGAVPVDWANSVGVLSAADRIDPRYRGPQTADALKSMTPQEIMALARAGQLENIGVGVPKSSGISPMLRRR